MKSLERKREFKTQNHSKNLLLPSQLVVGFLVFVTGFCLQDKYLLAVFRDDLALLHDHHLKLSELVRWDDASVEFIGSTGNSHPRQLVICGLTSSWSTPGDGREIELIFYNPFI